MFFRMRSALAVALVVTLMISITVFAKGGFSFISIKSPDLPEAVRAADPALTEDFFAFADFSQSAVKAPLDPGRGFEITRYYMGGSGETAFDQLHYYPDTGFVYYDGIAGNGWSEYDGTWYTANPEIRAAFENALPEEVRSVASLTKTRPVPSLSRSQPIPLPSAIAGLVLILLFAFRLRRPAKR